MSNPTFQNVSGSGKDLGQGYVNFTRNNMDQIRGKVNDELWILNFFEQWYTQQINMLCNWLSERLGHSLHFYQCTCLAHIVKVNHIISFNSMFYRMLQHYCIQQIFGQQIWTKIGFIVFSLENLFGFRIARCNGGQIEFESISNCIAAYANGRGNMCIDNEHAWRWYWVSVCIRDHPKKKIIMN